MWVGGLWMTFLTVNAEFPCQTVGRVAVPPDPVHTVSTVYKATEHSTPGEYEYMVIRIFTFIRRHNRGH